MAHPNLPHDGMDFTPFDVLTAEELDNMVANIESLAGGTGFDDGAVGPESRSGGFFIGKITGSTLGTTGNKAITGVGFSPRLVRFTLTPESAGGAAVNFAVGAMTSAAQFYATTAGSGSSFSRRGGTDAVMSYISPGGTVLFKAAYVSLDSDGFTINVTTAASTFDLSYEAYA